MSVEKITSAIQNSSFVRGVPNSLEKAGRQINNFMDKHSVADKFLKVVEPTGANNSFIPMASLMVGTVIVPRVLTAAKRNPDDKEATKDEVTEILFRDVQTVVIMLFLLKTINSLAAAATTKFKGLPMITKPYEKLFQNGADGSILDKLKANAKEFLNSPLDKLKTIGKNVLDTVHPTQGVRALTNDEFVSKYSGFESTQEVEKLFQNIDKNGGDSKKVFNNLLNGLISKQDSYITEQKGLGNVVDSSVKKALEAMKNSGKGIKAIEDIKDEKTKAKVEDIILNFFKDKDNGLVKESKSLNAVLRTGALAFEALYLGFGLPALNQRRLEKKYLKNGEGNVVSFTSTNKNEATNINSSISQQEKQLFSQFLNK